MLDEKAFFTTINQAERLSLQTYGMTVKCFLDSYPNNAKKYCIYNNEKSQSGLYFFRRETLNTAP